MDGAESLGVETEALGFISLCDVYYNDGPMNLSNDEYGYVEGWMFLQLGFNGRQSQFLVDMLQYFKTLGLWDLLSLMNVLFTISQAKVLNSIVPNICDVAKIYVDAHFKNSVLISGEINPILNCAQTDEQVANCLRKYFLDKNRALDDKFDDFRRIIDAEKSDNNEVLSSVEDYTKEHFVRERK